MTAQTQNAQISIGEAMEILNIRGRQTLYNLIDREGLTVTRSKIGRGRGGQRVFLQRAEIEKLRDADAAARASASAPGAAKPARAPQSVRTPKRSKRATAAKREPTK